MIEIAVRTGAVPEMLESLRDGLADGETLHLSMAMGVEAAIKDHFSAAGYLERRNKLGGQTTSFWRRVLDSTAVEASETEATVSITQRGAALRYYGGEVRMKDKLLSVPVHASAHGLSASLYPGDLVFRRAKGGGGGDTAGYLFLRGAAGPQGSAVEGPRNRDGGEVMGPMVYVLRRKTTHAPDPDMLPSEATMAAAATAGASEYIAALMEDRT